MQYILDKFSQRGLKMKIETEFEQNQNYEETNRFSVLIGNNGTGKSRLLAEIAETFSTLEREEGESPADLPRHPRPEKTLAISNMVFDKYPLTHWGNDRYVYLGARQGSNMLTTSTWSTYVHECITLLFISKRLTSLSPTLELLGLRLADDPVFFRPGDTRKRLEEVLGFLTQDGGGHSTSASSMREPLIIKQIRTMNRENCNVLLGLVQKILQFPSSSEKVRRISRHARGFSVNELFPSMSDGEELALRFCFHHNLIKANVTFVRQDVYLLVEELSAGEQLLLSLMARVVTYVRRNALVLIDEPDVGLHPDWQSSLIPLLRRSIAPELGSHFLMATHSPLIVADGTDVLIPGRSTGTFVPFAGNIEGRSIETILYEAFAARSPRSHLVELDLSFLIKAVSGSSRRIDKDRMVAAVERLNAIAGYDTPAVNIVLADAIRMLSEI